MSVNPRDWKCFPAHIKCVLKMAAHFAAMKMKSTKSEFVAVY